MADFLVSPPESTDLRIEPSQLERALRESWPDVRFIKDQVVESLRWALTITPGRELWGELQPDGQAVALDGDVRDAAEFARWLRGQVPQRYALIFYDQGYAHDVPLTERTSVEELAQPFLIQP